jgi:3-dehydroquinate synthase
VTTLTVDLGPRSYPIYIENGLLGSLGDLLKSLHIQGSVGLVTNHTIYKHYGEQVELAASSAGCKLTTEFIPDGESAKNQTTVSTLYDAFLEAGLDRSSTLISLGGGVVGDITGFVAATLFRGIRYLHIPTSLLAMVDASIGGKTGINHPGGKNLIGAFHQPIAVIIDPALTRTLPRREVNAALAEIIKAAVVADADFFHSLSTNIELLIHQSDHPFLEQVIVRSCEIKARIIMDDEWEGDQRRILNYGHTIGHALEAACGYSTYIHGEAVAIGMIGASYLSTQILGFPILEHKQLASLISKLEIPSLPDLDVDVFYQVLQHDKKIRNGVLHYVLLKTIGHPMITDQVAQSQLTAAINEIQRRFE